MNRRIIMKKGNKAGIVIAFALMALIARPQIVFAQDSATQATPIRGSWDRLKAIPPGDEVAVTLRNGKTLKGRLINISDTVLTLSQGKKTSDVSRGDALKVYRVVQKSAARSTMIGVAIGVGVGALVGGATVAALSEGSEDAGIWVLGSLFFGAIGAGFGALIGFLQGSRKQRELIYEAK
jgi:hypothetical protein